MTISILTLFPEVFIPLINTSILDRAQVLGQVKYNLVNIRDFGQGTHKSVDDRPYGGGPGMILRVDVLAKALESVTRKKQKSESQSVILTSASGKTFKQQTARDFTKLDHLVIVCGHYEGIDQRFTDLFVDLEVSIGDYVLTGGEIPAMVILDSVVRLLPKVLKKDEATSKESFSQNLVEYPQYTRPAEFRGKAVPKVLLSGNHQEIENWHHAKSLEKTKQNRPDLLKKGY